MNRIATLITIATFFFSCSESPKLVGLWELKAVSVDMIPRNSRPIYLKFERGGGFYVSKESGDLVGIYQINTNNLSLSSDDEKWFNTSWEANVYRDELVLEGQEYGYRTTKLRFKQVEKFPAFDEFQQELSGIWKLYKIEQGGDSRAVNNIQFVITEEDYTISQNDTPIEQGKVLIDTRHQKINFENEETVWSARFVWNELRLENKKMDIVYRLKKD